MPEPVMEKAKKQLAPRLSAFAASSVFNIASRSVLAAGDQHHQQERRRRMRNGGTPHACGTPRAAVDPRLRGWGHREQPSIHPMSSAFLPSASFEAEEEALPARASTDRL